MDAGAELGLRAGVCMGLSLAPETACRREVLFPVLGCVTGRHRVGCGKSSRHEGCHGQMARCVFQAGMGCVPVKFALGLRTAGVMGLGMHYVVGYMHF